MDLARLIVTPGEAPGLAERETDATWGLSSKEEGVASLEADGRLLRDLQGALYAENARAVLVILQGMDTCGKDGIVRHVMSGVNPQGLRIRSFGPPSAAELEHDFLWRAVVALPERGTIGVFNRSYYEEVLVVRVHPRLLEAQRLPAEESGEGVWQRRFEAINGFERHLTRSGTRVVKILLHLSKGEQRRRLLARIDDPQKHWKFDLGDLDERAKWDEYMAAYESALTATSTSDAPWYVVPADRKWYARACVARLLVETLERMEPRYPTVDDEYRRRLYEARDRLERE